MLKIKPIKTNIYNLGDDFNNFLYQSLKGINLENKILAITSKIVSISENEIVKKNSISKEELIKNEADIYLGKTLYDCHLTIKHGLVIPSAGIDESNISDENYLLFPNNPFLSAKKIHNLIKSLFNLKNFGLIITDSKTLPLKRGVVGTCLAYHGFSGLINKIGCKDLYGKPLEHTQVNICEALAAASTLLMGEASERQPMALIDTKVSFSEFDAFQEQVIPIDEDIYSPIFMKLLQN